MSDAELIISRTESIIGEAKLTASKAKAIISEADLSDEQVKDKYPLPEERARSASPSGRSLRKRVRASRFD